MNPTRKITRFHFDISELGVKVKDIMEQIEKVVNISSENMVVCKIKPNGQLDLYPENSCFYSDNDFTILQIPGEINEQLLQNNLIIAVVYFVFGSVPNREIFGEPYITILNRDLGSGHLSFEIMKEGAFLLPQLFYKMNAGFTLFLQNSDGTFSRIDPIIEKPLLNEYSEKCTKKNVATPLELTELWWFFDGRYKEYKYDLSCVIFHHGNQSSSGHYTAATRNFIDGEWRLFDDTRVEKLNQESQRKEIFESSNSFMLFYQRDRSEYEYRHREDPWFPRDVPYEIIKKYDLEEFFKNYK
uniref:ubiquitinyl hydrolase 1 n=1 Tax=Meloidogyne javanica TaxID=6303 RepID=A0A915NA59_MELJA